MAIARRVQQTGAATVPTTVGRWLGPPERPVFAWLTTPGALVTQSGVLVLPATGYQYWSSHRAVREVAERLAAAGHTVLRLDYDGTGDSAGDHWDRDRIAAWRASVIAGAAELRGLGATQLTILGVRLGGTLALLCARELSADAVIAWEPVGSGRRYAKEIRLLATPLPEDLPEAEEGTVVAAGVVYRAQTLADLEGLDLTVLDGPVAPRTLLVGRREDAKLLAALRAGGGDAQFALGADGAQALEVPAEDATVPSAVVAVIGEWMGKADPGLDAVPAPVEEGALSARAEFAVPGGVVCEQAIALGRDALVGILTTPCSSEAKPATLVFLNSGSEPHIGSGRAWVEYARGLAAAGYPCLRVDFRGWGESPDDGHAPGRPYDQHGVEDAIAIVRALRARGHERVVLLGLCAGAWIALRAALTEPLGGVIALNPQLYWAPGDPVEALLSDTRVRRTAERRREERGGRWGLWSALDVIGRRNWVGRWLDGLDASGNQVAMVFAEGDDGIEYLRNRVRRRLGRVRRTGLIRVVEVPDIDHSMHRAWLRGRMLETLRQQLDTFSAVSP